MPPIPLLVLVLQQYVVDTWQPISYFSRKLQPSETRYSTFDRELLAIYLTIKHFRHYVEGQQFCLLIDHKPPTFLFFVTPTGTPLDKPDILDYISQFTADIRHVKGSDNPVADALFRADIQAVHHDLPPIDYAAMATAQSNVPELRHLKDSSTCLKFSDVPVGGSTLTISCEVSTGRQRPYVPNSFWYPIF